MLELEDGRLVKENGNWILECRQLRNKYEIINQVGTSEGKMSNGGGSRLKVCGP